MITSPDADLRRRQWESLAMLVRPDGHLLVVVPSLESARYVAEKEVAEREATPAVGSQDVEPDLIRRTDTRQKHYSRAQIRRRFARQGWRVISLRRIHYPWSEAGLEHFAPKFPWDWVCLAQKAE